MRKIYKSLKPIKRSDDPIDPRVDIGHVHLRTTDMQRVYDFYVGILGFDVIMQVEGALFLSAGGYHHNLAFNTWESKGSVLPPPGASSLYHVAIRYPNRPALGDALRRLVKASWPVDGTSDHGTHEALYLRDPDGNGLEFYCDRPESKWPLDNNGHVNLEVGAPVDLQSLLKDAKKYHLRKK